MPRIFPGRSPRAQPVRAGYRIERVALKLEQPHYSTAEHERGRVKPSTQILIDVADLYGCTVDDLHEEVADAV